MYRVAIPRRRIARTNIERCFPDKSAEEHERLVHASFREVGIGVAETCLCWWMPKEKLQAISRIEGREHLTEALAHGKGVILLSCHTTNLEMGATLIALEGPTQAVFKKARNPLFNAVMLHKRGAMAAGPLIDRKDIRGIVRGLRQNLPMWYGLDQDFGTHNSVFVPFFGIQTSTLTALSRLARMSGAKVVPFFPRRLPDKQGYLLKLSPALENFPSGDDTQDAHAVSRAIEAHVASVPEQYLWQHRRFKTRPPGEPPFYS